jgi:hypothetical protein
MAAHEMVDEPYVNLDRAIKACSTSELEEAFAEAVHRLTGAKVSVSVSALEFGFVRGTQLKLTLHQKFEGGLFGDARVA